MCQWKKGLQSPPLSHNPQSSSTWSNHVVLSHPIGSVLQILIYNHVSSNSVIKHWIPSSKKFFSNYSLLSDLTHLTILGKNKVPKLLIIWCSPYTYCFITVIVPHIGSATTWTRGEMCILTARNIIAALDDQPMPAEVLWSKTLKDAYSMIIPFMQNNGKWLKSGIQSYFQVFLISHEETFQWCVYQFNERECKVVGYSNAVCWRIKLKFIWQLIEHTHSTRLHDNLLSGSRDEKQI
jgi:hypothetical protein